LEKPEMVILTYKYVCTFCAGSILEY
jgi:hypothetical protein